MGRVLWLADYLADEGLNPAVVPGWETRGREGLNAQGVLSHHIGIGGDGNAPGLRAVTYGHGSLKGNALCNVHQARNGRPTVVASGLAWHAGRGGLWGYTGNGSVLGIEAEGTTGQHVSDQQYDMHAGICAALLRGLRKEEGRWATHHDWRSDKPDMWALIHTRGGRPAFRRTLADRHIVMPPNGPLHDISEDAMFVQIVQVRVGADGSGWTYWAPGPKPRPVTASLHGPAPEVDGYWYADHQPVASMQERGGRLIVTVDGARPNSVVPVRAVAA